MDKEQSTPTRSSIPNAREYVPLILSAMEMRRISGSELARRTGVGKSKLCRGLKGRCSLDPATLQSIFTELDIDDQRALLAIGFLGDWQRYFDPDIEIVGGLIEQLPEAMATARGCGERVALGAVIIRRLAVLVSSIVAQNDRDVCERRDAFLRNDSGRRSLS